MKRLTQTLDRRARWITVLVSVVVVLFLVWVFWRSGGTFLPAWLTMLSCLVWAFLALSLPRFITLQHNAIEIDCVLELRRIEYKDIKSITPLVSSTRGLFPLLGIYGFLGYYGYYIGWGQLKLYKVYARRWNGLVLIETAHGRTVISTDEPYEFI
ncbi:MAG: PH domain-containing protein, partial [Mucinivorans sp.]